LVVCLDADNTLWDTDSVFATAQYHLLTNVITATGLETTEQDRLAYVREIDQELASRHHLGLRYPARMLIAALCYRLLGLDLSVAARKTWNNPSSFPLANDVADEIEQQYLADLQETPKLLPGVCTGLERLHRANAILILVTEGGRSRVQKLLRANKIDG